MASTSRSTPSQSARKIEYDVFLSFRGTDTRKTFVDHLYKELQQKEICTFKDDKDLEKGERIEKLLQIIKESRFAIVVFSKDYASSRWCLEEIATIMECQQQYGENIMIPIFYDVEPANVCYQTESFAESFKKHEKRFKDDQTKVERWKEALKKAGECSGHHLQHHYNKHEADCITAVVDDILKRLPPPPSGQQNLVGLKSQLAEIGEKLELSSGDAKLILGICGMGGIGKTTLAVAAFEKFSKEFKHSSFVSDVRTKKMEELQLKLLKDNRSIQINSMYDGFSKIQAMLKDKRVLIVLDDVDHENQLEQLVGDGEWLCKGSRVIITTRNKQLLHSFRVVTRRYDVDKMDVGKALELFSRHAFKKENPDKEFEDLSRDFVNCADGLPLALKVWGSAVCENNKGFWKDTLEKIKSISEDGDEICEKLKISYDGLDKDQKKIFLNIACFFRHKRLDYVKHVLESCDLHPGNGINVLIKKCLLFESRDGDIDMHDLIQDMGWSVAREETPRTRLWQPKDVGDVLRGNMEHRHIEGFLFSFTNKYRDDEKTLKAVKEMINLKLLIVGGADKNFPDVDNFLPRNLRCLDFPHYNSPSLPKIFYPSNNPLELVGFCLRHSSLESCKIIKELNKLTYLDLSSSRSLLETPNFRWMPNLERLYLSNCVNLIKIQPSIGDLQKLVLLDLSRCYELEKLPRFDQVSSLEFLKLEYCGKLQNFPEIQTNMRYVEELNLKGIGIEELPSSIRQLCGLKKLCLILCENLVRLPNELCELESLQILELRDCYKLKSLPRNLGNLSKLEELHIFHTAIFKLPSSIKQLRSLECLCWGAYDDEEESDKENTRYCVPRASGLLSLKRLQLYHINIVRLPSDLGRLISLEYLDLRGSYFVDLPPSFPQLPRLQYLDIRDCKKPNVRLPQLPETTRELYADCHLVSRRNIHELAKSPELHSVSFRQHYDLNPDWEWNSLAKTCILLPLDRKTPFSVNYPHDVNEYDLNLHYPPPISALLISAFRLFQYRCYQSNGISIDLNPSCQSFEGFVVYITLSDSDDIWGPHSYKYDDSVKQCTIIVKLSHKDDGNKVLPRKCVIVKSPTVTYDEDYAKPYICFAYIPLSSFWPAQSNTNTIAPNDFSRFEVKFMNSEATADWGCSLLYKWSERAANWDESSPGHTTDTGPLGMLEYLNLSGKEFKHLLPEDIGRLCRLQYLDISGCKKLGELPELPATIRELYAAYDERLASKSNIAELATKYSELYSVSFSYHIVDDDYDDYPGRLASLVPGELATEFIPITQPFLNRNTPFAVTYPIFEPDDYNISGCFKYRHHDPHLHDPHKISISLDPTWYSHKFVGFVVCFVFPNDVRWKSHPNSLPFRYCKLITKLTHKDNGSDHEPPLKTECVIGRLYCQEFNGSEDELVCFAYIPFSSLWPKSKAITDITIPNHYLVFEAVIQDLESSENFDLKNSTHWSCGLLYTDDKSLTKAIQQKREAGFSESHSGIGSKTEEEEEEDEDEDEDEDEEEEEEEDGDGEEEEEEEEEEDEDEEEEEDGDQDEDEDEDGGSQHTEDIGGDDALADDSNPVKEAEAVGAREALNWLKENSLEEMDAKTVVTAIHGGAAEKKTSSKRAAAALKIDEVEATATATATATSTGAKKIRLQKGIVNRSPKSSPVVPHLLSADFMVSKALEKAAAAAAVTSEKMDYVLPAAPLLESQININNIVDSDEVGLVAGIVSTELGADEAALAGPSQQVPEAIIPSPDLVLAISPGNLNLQTQRPSKKRLLGLDNNDPFKLAAAGLEENSSLSVLDSCVGEDADELFLIKTLRPACAITEKLLDKKRHLKNELSQERSRVTGLEEKNRQLEARNKELAVQLTREAQTHTAWATQAKAFSSNLLLAQKNLQERYVTLEKQQLEDKEQYKKLEKEQLEVKDQLEFVKKKLLQAEESGVSNWQQSPNFLNEVISRAMGQPEQRRKFFQVLEANPAGKEKLFDDNTNACLHGMRKMQQAIYNRLREIAPDDFDVEKWGLPKQLPDTESQNGAGSSMQGPGSNQGS